MARINSKKGVQYEAFDGAAAGEGLAIFFSQNGDSVCRYRCLVKAMIGEGVFDVGEFFISPPGVTSIPGRLSRMVAGAVCPGATSWAIQISAIPSNDEETIPAETADIILSSSRCCTSPIGVTRVGERYNYVADSSPSGLSTFTVRAGMTITGVAAIGLTGGGTIDLGGDSIVVPEGISMNMEPKAPLVPNQLITLSNVDWVIEYLESA